MITIRSDDFDFRMPLEAYVDVHQKFIDRGLTETAVIQFTNEGNEPDWGKKQGIIDYLNTAPNWDIQLHGWSHAAYNEMTQTEIADDLQKSMDMSMTLFGKYMDVWYPPRNCISEDMEYVADAFGLKIDNESYDIERFIREKDHYKGHSFYFHTWRKPEVDLLDEALDIAKELK